MGEVRFEFRLNPQGSATEFALLNERRTGFLVSLKRQHHLCRSELTASQRTGYTKRRKQIWEALHPETQVAHVAPPVIGYASPPPQTQGFAASTAASTGMTKLAINRHIARADAQGDDVERITGTSLDSGVEMDALAKPPAPERTEIIDRAVAA